MARKDNLTFAEIQEAEEASENRRRSRDQGFKKMHERDQAVQILSNGALMLWHVPRELMKLEGTITMNDGRVVEVTTYPPQIPEDKFGLDLACSNCHKKSRYLFSLAEFRKWLRWA